MISFAAISGHWEVDNNQSKEETAWIKNQGCARSGTSLLGTQHASSAIQSMLLDKAPVC